MFSPSPADEMSADRRVSEIAALLARGVLRLKTRRTPSDPSGPRKASQEIAEFCLRGLDLSAQTRLSVHAG